MYNILTSILLLTNFVSILDKKSTGKNNARNNKKPQRRNKKKNKIILHERAAK